MTLRAVHPRWLVVLMLLPLVGAADTTLTPQPLAKIGPCPSGYTTSGHYCAPGQKARLALEKRGTCPRGYATSGAYCLAGPAARPAVPKRGTTCPAGWSTSGDFCLRNRP
ncbi:hypothetical protein CCR95_04250 [Thiocystis minor]|uniref:hypothetical protein n=1 Tax=Thiocystis minor TaxID=61597 RepID=UPI0019146616|nr:hypothetical protein [Thiocystis minor]MBK5963320.1 hypothetical protein [Thiocystis minor]